MAEEKGQLTLPENSIWSEWTFGQVLLALTGDAIDLDTAAKASWFKFLETPDDKSQISYHAYETYYYGVNYNEEAFKAWNDVVTRMNEVMVALPTGRRGAMDLPTLYEAAELIDRYARWVDLSANDFRAWVVNLDRDDSAFKGKAASIIQLLMLDNAQMLESASEQVSYGGGLAMSQALFDLYDTMLQGVKILAAAWEEIGPKIANVVAETAKTLVAEDIHMYLGLNGIVLAWEFETLYKLDEIAENSGGTKDASVEYIELVMSSYRYGDLRLASTWDALSERVSEQVKPYLEVLNAQAGRVMAQMEPVLATATSALKAITVTSDVETGGGATPTPEVPEIDLTGIDGLDIPGLDDTEIPDLSSDVPDIDDQLATDVPSLGDPGSATSDVPGLDVPSVGDSTLADPGLADTGLTDTGLANTGVTDTGLADAGLADTGLADSGLSAGGTSGLTPLPVGLTGTGTTTGDRPRDATGITTPFSGGTAGGAGLDDLGAVGAGSGLDAGGSSTLPDDLATSGFGGGGDDGLGAVSSGLEPSESAGGAGSPGGTSAPGSPGGGAGFVGGSGVEGLPTSQLMGTPMGAGAGMGGMPMGMPMGGMGGTGQGDQNKDRERQTWLAEDESVWGTHRGSGVGVIGRLDEDDVEEFSVLAGPAARVRRPVKKDAAAEQNVQAEA